MENFNNIIADIALNDDNINVNCTNCNTQTVINLATTERLGAYCSYCRSKLPITLEAVRIMVKKQNKIESMISMIMIKLGLK
jgi:hypothetical protein